MLFLQIKYKFDSQVFIIYKVENFSFKKNTYFI